MKYLKAQNILAEELIEEIQQHIDGVYIYIPRKSENKRTWGENSGIKKELKERNREIYQKFLRGASIPSLSEHYYLTEYSIKRIIKKIEKQQ